MQDPKETTPHVVENTSCVHETGCVTLRYALIVDERPKRSATSTDAIPHLYLKSNQMLDFCLLIWHHECLCSSSAWFEAETEKRTVLEDLSLSEGTEAANGTIHLRWTCSDDMRGSASKSLHTNFCTRWSWMITRPGHFTSWNRAPPLLSLLPLDEVIVGPGSFWQKENLIAIPDKEIRLVKTLGGYLEWRIIVLQATKTTTYKNSGCGRVSMRPLPHSGTETDMHCVKYLQYIVITTAPCYVA